MARGEGSRESPICATRNCGSFASGLVVLLGLALFDPSHSFRESIVPALVVLPIFLLGGYLTAVWQWQDFEKKYSEDRLPPSE